MENSVIARLSLVVGLPLLGAGNSFLAKMLTKLEEGETIKVPENEIRTPVDVITLGRALLELAENDFGGVIHLAGSDRLARYDMARRIAAHLGLPRELIVAVNSNAIPGRAPRPEDASLDNSKAKKMLRTPMHSLSGGLELILNFKEN